MTGTEQKKDCEYALRKLIAAVEAITYEHKGRIYIGRHDDGDCTEDVRPALDNAKNLLNATY